MKNTTTTMYPSNWLYNAGVLGLLKVLESIQNNVSDFLSDDGTIEASELIDSLQRAINSKNVTSPSPPIDKLPIWHWNYAKLSFEWNYRSIKTFVSRNLKTASRVTNKNQLRDQLKCKRFKYEDVQVDFEEINRQILESWGKAFGRNATLSLAGAADEIANAIEKKRDAYIYRKGIGYLFPKGGFYGNLFNPNWFDDLKRFIEFFAEPNILKNSKSNVKCAFCSSKDFEVEPIDATQMSSLFPVFSQFRNAYWQNDEKAVTQICSLCKFMIIHHHLALSRLSDGSEIFVNAPSFKVMFELNRLARGLYGASTSEDTRGKREILAMSVIEYATRTIATLGLWTGMNLEIVSRKGGKIEFFSIPQEVIQLLSDRAIASLLSDIGEFKVLNLILSQDFSRLVYIGHGLLRESLVGGERRPIADEWLFRWMNKGPALQRTAEKILRLYALIDQKQRRTNYGRTRAAAI